MQPIPTYTIGQKACLKKVSSPLYRRQKRRVKIHSSCSLQWRRQVDSSVAVCWLNRRLQRHWTLCAAALPRAQELLLIGNMMLADSATRYVKKSIRPCIPPMKTHERPIQYDKQLYKQRKKTETCLAKSKTFLASQPIKIIESILHAFIIILDLNS